MSKSFYNFAGVQAASEVLAYESWSPFTVKLLAIDLSPSWDDTPAVGYGVETETAGRHYAKFINAPASNHIDIFAQLLPTGLGQNNIYFAGADGENCYQISVNRENQFLKLIKTVNGVQSDLSSQIAVSFTNATPINITASWNSATGAIQVKLWKTADPEPASPQIDVIDSAPDAHTSAGTIGVFSFSRDDGFLVSRLGVGTDGDIADRDVTPPLTAPATVTPTVATSLALTGDVTVTALTLSDGTGTETQTLGAKTYDAVDDLTTYAFTPVQGNLPFGTGYTLEATLSDASTVSGTTELVAIAGNAAVDVVDPVTTENSVYHEATSPNADTPETGDQIEHTDSGNTTVSADGTITQTEVRNFEARFWSVTDRTWGSFETISPFDVDAATGGGLTRRNLTRRALTRRNLTSRSLTA